MFVALTFTVFVGTTYPLMAEALRGVKVSVGEPYYNQMAVPLGVAILFLMGVGPALPWGQPSAERLRKLAYPLGLGFGFVALGWLGGVQGGWPSIALFCAGFASHVTLAELYVSFAAGFSRQSRRIGGYIVHAGIIVMLVAVAISSAFRIDQEAHLSKGETVEFAGYSLTYVSAEKIEESNRERQVAHIDVRKQGALVTSLNPALNIYPGMGSPIGTPAVYTTVQHDLYLSLMSIEPERIGVHMFRTPLIVWLWVGGGIVALGTLLALIPVKVRA